MINPWLWCVIVLALSQISGCAYIQKRATLTPTVIDSEALEDANSRPLKIRRILQSKRMALDTLPIGAIIPYYAVDTLELPENWRYCNGDVVNDVDSPLNGKRLPELVDDRFLMGSFVLHGEAGGDNILSPSGDHSHGGLTSPSSTNAPVKQVGTSGAQVRIVEQDHQHNIQKDGDHDHGGDRRPRWFGLLYIIKIK